MAEVPNPEYVLALAERLRQARNLLAKLEEEWAALFIREREDQDSATENDSPAMLTSLSARITELLRNYPSKTFTAEEVTTALEAKASSVSSLLSRLVKEGVIEKRSPSEYGAKRNAIPDLRIMQHVMSSALQKAGHNTAAALLGQAFCERKDGELLIQVNVRRTMLELTFNAEAKQICRQAMFSLGRKEPLVFLASNGERV